ncbi:MAG: extracellular solute-binding protein [Ruminiclostridium sp.]
MIHKKAAAAILTAFACIICSGCSDSSLIITDHTSDTSSAVESKPYKVESGLTKDDITLTVWESSNGPDEWIEKAGQEFTKYYPNIHIEYVHVEITDAYLELTSEESEVAKPDLFGSPCDMAGKLIEQGLILPTKDSEQVGTMALSMATDALTCNGVMYGYPTSCETYALYYNKNLVAEKDIPSTWEELIPWCKTFNGMYTDKYGFIFHTDSMYYISMLMSTANNKLMDGENYGLFSDEALRGVDLLCQMKDILPDVTGFTYDDYDNVFLSGNAALTVNGPWFAAKADKAGMNYGVIKLPDFDRNGDVTYSLAGVRTMFVYSKSEHPNEAAAFGKFLLTEAMQKLRLEITNTLPAANIAIGDKLDGFVDQLQYSYIMPNTPEMARFWDFGTHLYSDLCNGADHQQELRDFSSYIKNGELTAASTGITAITDNTDSTESSDSADSIDTDSSAEQSLSDI